MNRILPVFLLAGASLLSAQAHKPAKSASPSASKLISMKVTGSTRYRQEQIIAATGLKLGQTVNDADFKGISQHLGESGAFTSVNYTFQYGVEGIKAELKVTDSNPFVPVRFENFIWLSDQELLEKLSAQVPLFQGQLPASGTLVDDVSEVLQAFAIQRNMHGRVDYLRAGPENGPLEAFEFSITGQPITIHHISFTGAGESEQSLLETAARNLLGQEYTRSRLIGQADKTFLPVFLGHGYLKAAISAPQPKIAEETPDEILVDVNFPVTPGLQYKLSAIELSGYKNVFPVEQLRALIHLQPGEVANAVQADKDVEALKQLYGTRGYMGVQIRPAPEMNDADSTVKYVFQFEEGVVYKMGDLEVRGLDSKATERIGIDWKILPGQTYDSGYLKTFLDSIRGQFPADQWKITFRETTEDQDKIVDVSLRFVAIR